MTRFVRFWTRWLTEPCSANCGSWYGHVPPVPCTHPRSQPRRGHCPPVRCTHPRSPQGPTVPKDAVLARRLLGHAFCCSAGMRLVPRFPCTPSLVSGDRNASPGDTTSKSAHAAQMLPCCMRWGQPDSYGYHPSDYPQTPRPAHS